jgi:hypothetical protein
MSEFLKGERPRFCGRSQAPDVAVGQGNKGFKEKPKKLKFKGEIKQF